MSRYQPYPAYKDSGVEWLGKIPEHWETSRLKFLCNITTGGKDTENKIDDGVYPFYVRSQTVERINSYSFDGEAILTAGDGVGVGKVFHYTNGKFDFHQRVYMFYDFKKVAGRFLFEYIKNNFYKVALVGVAKSTVDSLRLPLIQNFMITVPALQEQQIIANYLDKATTKIDTLIGKQIKLIELLNEKRQAVISTAVTRGLDSTVAMKDSGVEWLGEIPEHWKVSRLKFLCDIRTGGKDTENRVDNGEYPFYVRSQTIERINSYSFNGEAILTAGDGVGVGKVFHYTNGKFDFHQRVYMFYAFKKVTGKFLFEYIKNNFHKVALAGVAKSTVDSLRLPLIQNFIITTPPIQEQQSIVKYLDDKTSKIDTLITKAAKAIDLLKEKRIALISAVVTGKIDVGKEEEYFSK